MTRKVTANLYMTIDGRGAFPKYPGSDRQTSEPGPMWQHMWLDRFDDVTTVVMGRRSFLGHHKVWTESARSPKDPAHYRAYARWLDRVQKIFLTRTVKKTDWENTRIQKGDLSKLVAGLKREKGGNIILEGGPRMIQEVLRRDLADDYWMVMQPVVYGKGPRYWGAMKSQCTLKLLESIPMEDGEMLLHYEAVR